MRTLPQFVVVMALMPASLLAAESDDIASALMHTTFKIEGASSSKSGPPFGTAFLLAARHPDDPKKGDPILVTAAHVLENIAGDQATLFVRRRHADGSYEKVPWRLPIREKGIPLWTKHPKVDVAVMRVVLPAFATGGQPMLHLGFLADDTTFRLQDLRPGDELMCLGYPLGLESSPAGFPVLRSGRIASYPVYPSTAADRFLLDFEVYGGNSGGPVFFEFTGRKVGNQLNVGTTVEGIAGVASMDLSYTRRIESYFESGTRKDPLGLGVVIPGQFISEAVEMLLGRKASE